jgi:hypothetical protein
MTEEERKAFTNLILLCHPVPPEYSNA